MSEKDWADGGWKGMSLLGKLWEANSMDLVCVVDRSFLILGVVR